MRQQRLVWSERRVEPQDFLYVVATSSEVVNCSLFEQAHRLGSVQCGARWNAFQFLLSCRGAKRSSQITVFTAGHSGALAQRLREELEFQFGPECRRWLRWLGEARASPYDDPLSPRQRRALLRKLASRTGAGRIFSPLGRSAQKFREKVGLAR